MWCWLFTLNVCRGTFFWDEAHKDWCTVNESLDFTGLRPFMLCLRLQLNFSHSRDPPTPQKLESICSTFLPALHSPVTDTVMRDVNVDIDRHLISFYASAPGEDQLARVTDPVALQQCAETWRKTFLKERPGRDCQCDVHVGHQTWCLQQRHSCTHTHARTNTQTYHTHTHTQATATTRTHHPDTHSVSSAQCSGCQGDRFQTKRAQSERDYDSVKVVKCLDSNCLWKAEGDITAP